MLSSYRALDLTDEKGLLCGKVFGDLGMDVIKVEPPQGEQARLRPPFFHDEEHPERSLLWWAYNTSKRGITLNIASCQGQELFKRLVATADIVIESFPPGYMDSLGLGYDSLREVSPNIIVTSITPFGQSGPYREYKGSDLVVMAMGGMLYTMGYPDSPPVRISVDMAFNLASVYAAAGTLIALWHREVQGEGQHVDVSAQEAVVRNIAVELGFWKLEKELVQRQGVYRRRGRIWQRHTWRCKDGFVIWAFFGGLIGARQVRRLAEWMESERIDSILRDKAEGWERMSLDRVTQEEVDLWEQEFSKFALLHTKEELSKGATERGLFMMPVNTSRDVVEDEQLSARGFWALLRHGELDREIMYPGPFCRCSEKTPKPRFRASLIGEHNEDVYGKELGLSKELMAGLHEEEVI